jgi:hypothetical protein
MAIQTKNGKAFEYSLLNEFYERLSTKSNNVQIIDNLPYRTAKSFYDSFSDDEKGEYNLASSAAVNFLIDIEPRLSNSLGVDDKLQLEIMSDSKGQAGDVRDVLAIRLLQHWEIGISSKNNHRAVKHSRLSYKIDFGKKWLNIPCSQSYFNEIKPIFDYLTELRNREKNTCWNSISDMHKIIYVPILNAFKSELVRLDAENPDVFSKTLVEYLIGNKDFYKVIKSKNEIEVQAYNLHGTLNLAFEDVKPKAKIQKLKLPSRMIEIVYSKDSDTTLLVTLNEGWQISFRIHSASTLVEPSLKFDINLVSAPHTLFSNHIFTGVNK